MKAQKFITEANKQQVCKLLGWSLEQYAEYQQKQGLVYLEEVICCDAWSVNNVAKSPLFWRWWVNHWNARDAEFIAQTRYWPISWRGRKYEDLNDVDGFNFWPHRVIMEQTYCLMIDKLNKESITL